MTLPRYVTRERVQRTLDQADTFRVNAVIDAAIASATTGIEGWTHRYFYPVTATRYPDPWRQVSGGVLWLDSSTYEVCSVASLTVDGTALTEGTDFYLDPEDGPPFTSARLFRTSDAAWSTDERSIVLTGEIGASNATRAGGALASSTGSSSSTVIVTNGAFVGVGDLITIGAERLMVTDRMNTATGATITVALDDLDSDNVLTVSDGTLINQGETILINGERMFVEQVVGNAVTVQRAVTGSVLAVHTSSTAVYASRVLVVERGATGTTAATHTASTAVTVNDPPPLVQTATLAQALATLGVEWSAYAASNSGMQAKSLQQIIDDCVAAHGRVRIGVA
jgi:hypothetical protein